MAVTDSEGSIPLDDVQVVIRAAGERTERAASALAAAQVGAEAVALVREVPFSAALKRGLEVGVASGRPWILCLDADVMLRPGGIAALRAEGERALRDDPGLAGVSGLVADKLLGQRRVAGQHMYRAEAAAHALAHGVFDAGKRRPESDLKRQLQREGRPWRDVDAMTGLHDFEQAYVDIFRKVFTHARKHRRFMDYAERFWARAAPTDPDLRIALLTKRLAETVEETAPPNEAHLHKGVVIDRRHFPETLDTLLALAGMTEKPALETVAPDSVADALQAFTPAPEFEFDRALIAAIQADAGPFGRMRAHVAGNGLRAVPRVAGDALTRAGARLRRWSDRIV
jgi:hypothetical protein